MDISLVDWSRAQFALTAMYHWLFVPLTLGLGVIISIMETLYYKTGKEEWKRITKYWMRLFGVNFAIGVATGLILEFQFGTNWSNYSWFVGDIFGAPLAIEGIMAFFMETTFLAVMFFGWDRVSKGFHLASTWLTVIGASISALWILVANAWMQSPAGMVFNPDTVRNEMVDFWAVLFSPFAMNKFFHTISSGWVVGSAFVIGVSCWLLLKKKELSLARKSIPIASIFGLLGIGVSLFTGDGSAYKVAQYQPMKLAAMEGLYNGHTQAGLTVIAIPNPDKKSYDDPGDTFLWQFKIPKLLSLLSYRDGEAFVPGVKDLIEGGYPVYGKNEVALSAEEKIERGKTAIAALAAYRTAKKAGQDSLAAQSKEVLTQNYPYFGYGYIKDVKELVPNVWLTFWAFRLMILLGLYFLFFFLLFGLRKSRHWLVEQRWVQWIAVWSIPAAYLTTMAGWVVAEVGRQPWVIQDILPTFAAVSKLEVSSVQTTFILFCILFTTLLIAELSILFKQINKPS